MDKDSEKITPKEKRIRQITNIYYSRPEIQKAIYGFCNQREVCPRYFEGFGKRPDSFQYPSDVFEMAKKGATSFHCSEEIWSDPLKISTGMSPEQYSHLRTGWDLLIDIDCKWFDYSKKAAQAIINVLKKNKLKNIGIKFSGSKGFHIIIPWKAFPENISGIPTNELFPELPRKIIAYLRNESEKEMKEMLPDDFHAQFKNTNIKKGIQCIKCREISDTFKWTETYCPFCKIGEAKKVFSEETKTQKCPHCQEILEIINSKEFYECKKCKINSMEKPENFTKTIQFDAFELMGLDLVLVSPRHLFRTPYSLHEKTCLSSAVISEEEIENFHPKNAEPLKIEVKNFYPEPEQEEAKELVIRSLDWYEENSSQDSEKIKGKFSDFKPIHLKNILDEQFPPCVRKILSGIDDGRKRAVFVLINFFRSIGLEKEILEQKIYEWNKKNKIPLNEGYIKTQLLWAYNRKPILPPNCREFYAGIGVCIPDEFCSSIKNPVNYTVKKNLKEKRKTKNNKSI